MLINDPSVCFICKRRSDNFGVGRPDKIAWFCLVCGAQLARDAYDMAKKFDAYEREALAAVASKLPPDNFTFPADELPAFLEWAIQEFGNELRAKLAEIPPF